MRSDKDDSRDVVGTKKQSFLIRASRFNTSRDPFPLAANDLSFLSDDQRIDLLKILSKAVRSLCSEINSFATGIIVGSLTVMHHRLQPIQIISALFFRTLFF